MAYRDGAELHRRTSRRRHPPSPPQMADYDWHPIPHPVESAYDPMPYRRPRDFIQGPDSTSSPSPLGAPPRRIVKLSSAPPTPGATMPRTPKAGAPYRRGRVPVDNGYKTYDEEEEEEEDNEEESDDSEEEEESPLARRRQQQSSIRHRSRSTAHHSRTRPPVYESRRSSRYSRSESESESDEDSETSDSSEEEKRETRRERERRERERYQKAARHAQTVVERRTPPSADNTTKRRRKIKKIIYMEEDGSTEPTPRQSLGDLSRSSSRHRSHPSSSRPASERHYPRQHSYSPVRRSSRHHSSAKTYEISQPPSATKRLAYEILPDRSRLDVIPSRHSRRHQSQVVYPETRSIRRSNTVSGASHVTSHTRSTTSSSRPASTLVGNVLTGSTVSRSSEKPGARVECLICMEEFQPSRIAKLKCGHRQCDACLKRHFKLSITDPQQMPPKCCVANIPLKHVDHLFTPEFKQKWNRKFSEFTAANRIYCPSRKCGAWIKPEHFRNEGGGRQSTKCGQCKTKVCCSCNGKWHSSRECPSDEETTRFLDHAKDEGWKMCYKCSHMVELKEGCNHMTCICGAQFCMVCGTKWKSCDCPWFNYETVEAERLNEMHRPLAMGRMEQPDPGTETPRSARSIRSAGVGHTTPRSRSQEYDNRLMRRFQENRDEDLARTMQTYELDEAYDRGYGDLVGIGNTAGHFINEDYRRDTDVFASAPIPPAPTPPTAFERPPPTDYMSGVNRARGLPQDPLGQRLAERFSESRSSPGGPRPGMMAPPPLPPLAAMTAPIMGPPPPMMGPMAMGPPPPMPPPMPMLRRHTMEEELYNSVRSMRPSERMTPGRMIHDYEMEAAAHAHTPRSRRRMREEPKSSTLAGLTGIGRGVNRVHEWRNYVWPGQPEGEHTAVA
ncbi:hypothetical protein CABS03_12144 [Colletotrichum abscissum]|uniref:RBR-type E3 ubiquitin transferase n=1 Tax=Colletotrichum abscissum TaxID=1671311 RepID=A0A9P9XIC0_9PEZI|nr:hypothetical protein CABS02_05660 [Colletotrichum abscissum]